MVHGWIQDTLSKPSDAVCCFCRYWSDPAVLGKLSAVMGDTFDPAAMAAAAGGTGEGEAEEDDQEEELDVHGAASAGWCCALLSLHIAWGRSDMLLPVCVCLLSTWQSNCLGVSIRVIKVMMAVYSLQLALCLQQLVCLSALRLYCAHEACLSMSHMLFR